MMKNILFNHYQCYRNTTRQQRYSLKLAPLSSCLKGVSKRTIRVFQFFKLYFTNSLFSCFICMNLFTGSRRPFDRFSSILLTVYLRLLSYLKYLKCLQRYRSAVLQNSSFKLWSQTLVNQYCGNFLYSQPLIKDFVSRSHDKTIYNNHVLQSNPSVF